MYSLYNHTIFSTLLSLLKSPGTVFNLSISDFKLTKSTSLANFDVSTPAAFLNQILLHDQANLIQLLLCFYYEYMVLKNNSFFFINSTVKWIIIAFPFDM